MGPKTSILARLRGGPEEELPPVPEEIERAYARERAAVRASVDDWRQLHGEALPTLDDVFGEHGPGGMGRDIFFAYLEELEEAQPLSPRRRRPRKARTEVLLDAATHIAAVAPGSEDLAFTHAVLCQVGLPRSEVQGREFMRRSGAAWVNVQAGWLDEGRGPVLQPVPYGALPRLALAWISTQAVRTKDREIGIGSSASEFLRLLGKPTTGGVRGSFTTLRKQMHALAACRLQMGFKGRTFNGQPVEQFDAWLAQNSRQQALWPGVVVLSEAYFGSLLESAVPLDNRALMALSGSALALDIYTWLAHRLHRIEGRGVVLHWKSLREQFAQEYQGKDPDHDFKNTFLPALKKVLLVYPEAKVKPVTGGVLLLGSPPPIAYKS